MVFPSSDTGATSKEKTKTNPLVPSTPRGGTAPNDHSCGRPAQRIKPSPQSAGWGGDSFEVGLGAVAGTCVDHRSGQTRMPPQERRHEEALIFVWGILLRLDWEPLRGTCVGRGSGQTRMPPRERQHEEVFVWGILLRLDWEPLRGHGLAAGAASHACRRGSGSTRRFLFWGILLRLD